MTIGKYLMAFGLGLSLIGAAAVARADEPVHAKKHHAHRAYQPATASCWIDADKGAIDHGIYGYYVPCGTPGSIAAEYSPVGQGHWAAEQ